MHPKACNTALRSVRTHTHRAVHTRFNLRVGSGGWFHPPFKHALVCAVKQCSHIHVHVHKVVPHDSVCSQSVHFPWPTLRHWINPCEVVPGRKSYSVAYFDQITVFYTCSVLLYFVMDWARVCCVDATCMFK